MAINYNEAFKKPFTDFKKFIIGVLVSILPIVSWIALGYALESSGLSKHKKKTLPEWKNWGDLFITGLIAKVITLVYYLPAILIATLALFPVAGSAMGMLADDGWTVQQFQTMQRDRDLQIQFETYMQTNAPNFAQLLLPATPWLFLVLLGVIAAAYLAPMAILSYLKKKNFGSAFHCPTVFKKAGNPKYLLAWLAVLIVSIAAYTLLGRIIFGGAIVYFAMTVIKYSLFGQVYKSVRA